MRVLSWAVGVVTLLATGGYLFVYIYRWEWHRALLVGMLFLATLVALSAALVLRRPGAVERRLSAPVGAPDAALVLRRLQQAPASQRPFPWLGPQHLDRTNIFIPVLLGGGLVVSAVAWLVERLAGHSARAGIEDELAGQLHLVAFPSAPLVATEAELLAADDDCADDPLQRLLLGPSAAGGP
jgi:hypothetical protein